MDGKDGGVAWPQNGFSLLATALEGNPRPLLAAKEVRRTPLHRTRRVRCAVPDGYDVPHPTGAIKR